MTVTEDSIRPDSNSKFNFMHEVGDRLMQIITGQQNKFYSEFYGRTDLGYDEDGEFSKTALALGFWIRKFDDEKIEVSLKDFLETSNSIHNTGYGIETINGQEQIVVEDLKYFFQNVQLTKPHFLSSLLFYHIQIEEKLQLIKLILKAALLVS